MTETIRDRIAEYNEEAIMFDDLDDAIIGVGKQYGGQIVAIYDRQMCIDIFANDYLRKKKKEVKRELDNHEIYEAWVEAIAWFEHNVECTYAGDNTPIFLESLEND